MSETLGYSKRKSYICIARIRHASRRTAYQGGTFFIYTFMDYTNSPLEVPALIQTLKDRGLSITDDNKALAFLENVSYFRFRTYLRPMEQDTVMHQYKSGASFGKAVSLYLFDTRLRMLIFSAIQQIEVSLRAKIINHFSLSHGAFWFIQPELATDKHKFTENLSTLERELQRSKDEFIKEHCVKYGKEGYPPAWKILELVSFGCLTKLYFNFADTTIKKKIARSYGVPQHEMLESWMKAVNALRNACAHHERIWNRVMPVIPQLPATLRNTWITDKPQMANRFYAVFCCLIYWLNAIKPENTLVQDFKSLLQEFPNVDTTAMGFTTNWKEDPFWL